jgi:hypothetical protein
VELDMLSTAAVVRFQAVYEELARARARPEKHLAPPLWAHLGDFSDLSCVGEMKRMLALLEKYGGGQPLLAGIAPGNHDSAFTGNFGWSPYWDLACPTGRMDKVASDEELERFLASQPPRLVAGATTAAISGVGASAAVAGTLLARYTVTPLGTVPLPGGKARGVVGVFLDTSDRSLRDFGIAGSFGTFSPGQKREILAAVDRLKQTGPEAWKDPWFVLFGHVPHDELTPPSREALDDLVTQLDRPDDRCSPADPACHRPRVIALITAHTHKAGTHRHCVAQRELRELVVGSVIDPPEQASLLEIGLDERGRGSARLTTLPSVAREGLTCATDSGATTIDAGVCRRAMATLGAAPACQELVDGADAGEALGESCEDLERPLSVDDQIDGIVLHGGPQEVEALKLADDKRARALLDCVCRELPPEHGLPADPPPAACQAREPPLENESYAPAIEALARDPRRQQEMACLAWAAAAVQQHKAAGMDIADAIRCAFDDPTPPPAQVNVAVAEDVSCQ